MSSGNFCYLFLDLTLREIGVRCSMGVTRVLVKKYISKETIKQFQEIMLKYFQIRVTQKALITKTLPNTGGFIAGIWNYIAVGQVQGGDIDYFDARGE